MTAQVKNGRRCRPGDLEAEEKHRVVELRRIYHIPVERIAERFDVSEDCILKTLRRAGIDNQASHSKWDWL